MPIIQLPYELCEQVQPKDKAPCWSDSDSDPEELTADQFRIEAQLQVKAQLSVRASEVNP